MCWQRVCNGIIWQLLVSCCLGGDVFEIECDYCNGILQKKNGLQHKVSEIETPHHPITIPKLIPITSEGIISAWRKKECRASRGLTVQLLRGAFCGLFSHISPIYLSGLTLLLQSAA